MKRRLRTLLTATLSATLLLASSLTVFAADTTDITDESVDKSAEIELNIEINSTFTVGIPISADIDPATGTGTYDVSVLGDIDPRYKLVVAPIDEYTTELGDTTSDINFLLKDKANTINPKEDIIVNVTTGQTEFICTDINTETPVIVNNTMTVVDGKLTAGVWNGTMRYVISLELIPTTP